MANEFSLRLKRLSLQEIPQSIVIVGGGYIGVELGQMYAKFGTKVTILEGAKSILAGFEPEATRYRAT